MLRQTILITLFCLSANLIYSADYFWVNNGGNWSDFNNHWATTSGGTTMHTSLPDDGDNVFFDVNSFTNNSQIVTIDIDAFCGDMDWTGVSNSPALFGVSTRNLTISANLTFDPGMNNGFLGKITFNSFMARTIISAGNQFPGEILFEGVGNWTLQDNLTCLNNLDLYNGEIYVNGFTLSAEKFICNGSAPRLLDITNSEFLLSSSDTALYVNDFNFTLTSSGSAIRFTNTSVDTVYIVSGGSNIFYDTVKVESPMTYFHDNMFGNVLVANGGTELILSESETQEWNKLDINGTCTEYVKINSDFPDSTATLLVNNNSTNNYLLITDIEGTGATLTANNSIDNGGNSGWNINESASNGYVYWINGSGNWSDPSHWSSNCVPGPNDSIIFNASSFLGASNTVNLDVDGYGYSVTWNGVTGIPDFTGSNNLRLKGSLSLDPNMTSTHNGTILFVGNDFNQAITSSGVQLNSTIQINGTGSWLFMDPLVTNNNIEVFSGNLDFNDQDVEASQLNFSSSLTRDIDLTSSYIKLTGDENTFLINSSAISFNAGTSEIHFTTASHENALFIGGGLNFNVLELENSNTFIGGSNVFNRLTITPGSTLILDNATTQSLDSLEANGKCDSTITFKSFSPNLSPGIIAKTGYDTLYTSYLRLNHVEALITANEYYLAQNSDIFNTTTGWDTTFINLGADYYWIGNTGEWGDINNWQSPFGIAATCLPTIRDTVYFDMNSFSSSNQVVDLNVEGYCAKMDWTGSGVHTPFFEMNNNLNVRNEATLESGVEFIGNTNTSTLIFLPNGNDSYLNTDNCLIGSHLELNTEIPTEALFLNGNLWMTDSSIIEISEGIFNSNGDSIFCGYFNANSTYTKELNLSSSFIEVFHALDFSGINTINSGTSTILLENNEDLAFFIGGGYTFYNVELNAAEGLTYLENSNTFNDLTLGSGTLIELVSGETQTVNGNLIAIGQCENDTIFVRASNPGVSANISCSNPPTIEVVNFTDINASNTTINLLFSGNNGGNINCNFLNTAPTTADYSVPYDACINDVVNFTNSSTAYAGGISALSFEWNFGDGNTSTLQNPSNTFTSDGEYSISLTSFYTNGCSDTYLDTVRVNDPDITFIASDLDLTICAEDSVHFLASSPGVSNIEFFVNGLSVQSGTDGTYSTIDLVNNDSVYVEATLNGCVGSSDTGYVVTVNALPIVGLTSSDIDNIICDGDNVDFTSSGTDEYIFLLDDIEQNSAGNINLFSSSSLTNNQVISVIGIDTTTGCSDTSATEITINVNPLPTPSMTTSDADLVICQGDLVSFTGTNATEFEFFVNGTSMQGPSTISTFTTTTLNNNDEITLVGYTLGCPNQSIDDFTFFVNSSPNTVLTNNTGLTICAGDQVDFTASGATIYEFFIDGISQGAASGAPFFSTSNLSNGQVVHVEGSSNGCPGNSLNQTFIVNNLPTVNLNSTDTDNIICQGDNVIFTASGASAYEFFINGNSIAPASANATYSTNLLANGETVTVIGTNLGCSSLSTNSFNMSVTPAFSVNIFSTDVDLEICEGDNIDFTAIGSGINDYEFFINGNSAITNTNGNYSTTGLNSGINQVWASGTKNGCTYNTNDTLDINVISIPTVSLTSSDFDNTICNGDSVTFSSTGATEYEFFLDGTSLGTSTNTEYITNNLGDGQIVSVLGYNSGCPGISPTPITTTVNPVPTITLISDDIDNIICEGEDINITASGGTSYELFIDGFSNGPSNATSSYLLDTLTTAHNINFSGTLAGCSSTSNSINIQVNELPNVISTISDLDTTICEGDNVTISATGATTYSFYVDGTLAFPTSTQNTYNTDSLLNGEIITVEGTSFNGCLNQSDDIFTWMVNNTPSVNLASSAATNEICIGESVIFSASGALNFTYFINGDSATIGAIYQTDSISDGQTISVQGEENGCYSSFENLTFTVHQYPITSAFSSDTDLEICQNDLVSITGSGAPEYSFLINGTLVQGPSNTDTYNSSILNNGDQVQVVGSNFGCEDTTNALVYVVYSYPITGINSSDVDNEICFGELVTFTGNGATEYAIQVNGITQGTPSSTNSFDIDYLEDGDIVNIIGYNGHCPSPSSNLAHIVNTLPLTLDINGGHILCDNNNTAFTASGADQYEFFVNGSSQQGPNANNTFNASGLNNGEIITVEGTSLTTGCVQEAQTSHTMFVITQPTITALGDTFICEGDSVLLESDIINNIQWNFNNSEILGANTYLYAASDSGRYFVETGTGGIGEVFSTGLNAEGQLGNGEFTNSLSPSLALNLESILNIEAGQAFNIALDSNGVIYTIGDNTFGQLGDGSYTTSNTAYQTFVTNAVDIAAGSYHSAAVLDDGTLMTWGKNDLGQLGLGTNTTINFPFIVPGLIDINKVEAGLNHTLALKNDGTVWASGDNQYGQLGDSSLINRNNFVQVNNLQNIVDIACGANHSLAIDANGILYLWGSNSEGQLGNNTSVSSITPSTIGFDNALIARGGEDHTVILTTSNKVYTFGGNTYGQLGNGTNNTSHYPTQLTSLDQVKNIEAGTYHTAVIKEDKSVWTWGNNAEGQLGTQDLVDYNTPQYIQSLTGTTELALGFGHTSALLNEEATCPSNEIQVTVNPLSNVTLTMTNGTLLVTPSGDSYEWYIDGILIPYETNQTYSPTTPGVYHCEVTYSNGCVGSSNGYAYLVNDINVENLLPFVVFPNPAKNLITIQHNGNLDYIEIYSAEGKLIKSINENEVNIESLPKGLYLIHGYFGDNLVTTKFIKE